MSDERELSAEALSSNSQDAMANQRLLALADKARQLHIGCCEHRASVYARDSELARIEASINATLTVLRDLDAMARERIGR